MSSKRRVGIVGFGHLGQRLYDSLLSKDNYEVSFVWNRTKDALQGRVPKEIILDSLQNFRDRKSDLIVEVAHPDVTRDFGADFVSSADYLLGSPTALADDHVRGQLERSAVEHGLYVPAGALWGAEDILKMDRQGNLRALKVTMAKHPDSLKLNGDLEIKRKSVVDKSCILYDGPVGRLCPLAPNNVNTMAAAAVAANSLGFQNVQCRLIADPGLTDWHEVRVDVWGHPDRDGRQFHCQTIRMNPAPKGHVTGQATYGSLLASLTSAFGKGPGIHLC